MKAQINGSEYTISTKAVTKGLVNLFSETKIISGAAGTNLKSGNFVPKESKMHIYSRGKLKETLLKYNQGKIILFEASPELKRAYHIKKPIGVGNTLDPISATLWFLKEHEESRICRGKLSIFDGFRRSELTFLKISKVDSGLECVGVIKRVAGFKRSEIIKKPLYFRQLFSKSLDGRYRIEMFEVDTIYGRLLFKLAG